MLLSEFIDRTGYQPTAEEYQIIEQEYYLFDGNKDAFCKAWCKDNPTKAGQILRAQKEAQRIDRITRKCEAVILKRVNLADNNWDYMYIIEQTNVFKDDAFRVLNICNNDFLEAKRIMNNIEAYGTPMFKYWAVKVNDYLAYLK